MDEDNLKPLTESRVISTLAEVYKQLYLCPGREGQAQYDDVVKRGRDVKKKSLSHFCMDERDRLEYLDTPAGSVQCVTLHKRSDFVTFLQIMTNRCEAVDIPDTQGASLIDGVINRAKIKAHKEEFFKAEAEKGSLRPDWSTEFKRFTYRIRGIIRMRSLCFRSGLIMRSLP